VTNAAAWLRVSTGHQEADNQVPDVDRFTAHHGYQVTACYEVSESAWEGGKDGGEYQRTLRQALDDAHAGKFQVLIVWALDRITREGAEGALRIIRQFRQRGVIVVSVKESSPPGRSASVALPTTAGRCHDRSHEGAGGVDGAQRHHVPCQVNVLKF
jgi:DNA invertase Pin-like site-specific DNA recombinase